jgi:hypothetical protein
MTQGGPEWRITERVARVRDAVDLSGATTEELGARLNELRARRGAKPLPSPLDPNAVVHLAGGLFAARSRKWLDATKTAGGAPVGQRRAANTCSRSKGVA